MNRPASCIVPAFLAGVLVANSIPALPIWLMALSFTGAVWLILRAGSKGLILGVLLLALILGFFRGQQLNGQDSRGGDQLFFSQPLSQLTLAGQVTDVQPLTGFHVRYRIMINAVTQENQTAHVRIPVILLARDYQGIGTLIPPGSRVSIRGATMTHDLRKVQEEGFLKHWKAQGMKAVLETKGDGIIAGGVSNHITWSAYQVRRQCERMMDSLISEPENRVLKSLFFGNQGYLTTYLRTLFTSTGTAHLIAVSGLHVGIMSLFTQWLLGKAGAGKKASKGVTTLLVWFYAAMAGFPISILRAATMYTLYAAAFYTRRRYDGKSTLLWCCMFFVWLNPYSLFTISFQLSFAAVTSLLWLYPRMVSRMKVAPAPWLKLVLVTLAAQLGTWPVIAWHFGTFSSVSILTNLLVVPFIGIIMPLALVMTLTGFLSRTMAAVMATMVEGGLKYILWIVTRFSENPLAVVPVPQVHPAWYTLYYLVLISVALRLKKEPTCQVVCTGKEGVGIGQKSVNLD